MHTDKYTIPLSPEYRHLTYSDSSTVAVQQFITTNKGLLMIALAQVFFSLMNVMAKLLSEIGMSTFTLIFVRMSITYVLASLYMYSTSVPDWFLGPKEVRHLLVLRSTVGFAGLFSIYYSLQYLPLSEATVLTFLTPCCTLLLGYIFLGEEFSIKEALAGLVALLGVVIIARPFSFSVEPNRLSAVLVSLLGVCGAAGAYTTIRFIGKRAHALISVSMFSFFSCIYALGGLIVTGQQVVFPTGIHIVYLLFLGFSGFIAQFLLTYGLQREKAGRGASATYLQMFFAVVWEKLVFDSTPDFWSICGILLIVSSTVYVAVNPSKR